ncbi:MAG: glycosyltransferase [Eubacteriales bacterium]|nr:glycosyltransferase [Eubacteriales bacterium]
MGKTLANMLSWLPSDALAQLYFHHEVPTVDLCRRYFRITDVDVLRSILRRGNAGTVFGEQDIDTNRIAARTDSGVTAKVYQAGRKRSPFMYFARDMLWTIGSWNSRKLDRWIREFSPDLIFYASGDYSFSYRITEKLASRYHIPVVLYCCDDYYLTTRDRNRFLGRLNYRRRMKWLKKVSARTEQVIVISDKMQKAYRRIFHQPISVIRIASEMNPFAKSAEERSGILYAGGLGVGRSESIQEAGRALKKADISGFEQLDVYSGERNPRLLEAMNEENGICFHGAISGEQVLKKIGAARYVLLAESFDEDAKGRTRYSLSTKIGESLQSGAVLIAIGPEDISSMEYIRDREAGVVMQDPSELPQVIRHLETHPEEREKILVRAGKLAESCHDQKKNDEKLVDIFQKACGHR